MIRTTRRALLAAAGAAVAAPLTPERAFAAEASAEAWKLGLTDVAGDAPRTEMRLVRGRPPKDLEGVLYRNGPALWRRPGGDAGHWFDGDGLMRAFRIADGRATAEARFLDTPKRRRDAEANAVVTPGFGTAGRAGVAVGSSDDTSPANTSVLLAGDEVWALWEAGSPLRVGPEDLSTGGFVALRSDLKGMPFLAHPRIEPDGRVWNLGLGGGGQAVVWRLGPDGRLEDAQIVTLPRASYLHDFTATERSLVVVLQPWIQDRFALPFASSLNWRPEEGTQVVVIDKADLSRRRVYELPAFAFFHLDDAWEEADGTVRFTAATHTTPTLGVEGGAAMVRGVDLSPPPPRLARVTLGGDGKGRYELLPTVAEFPRNDPRLAGRRHALVTHVTGEILGRPLARSVAVTDLDGGRVAVHDFGGGHLAEEMLFVPRPGRSGERDAWLVGTSINTAALATELHVFEAANVDAGPVCTWRADRLWPVGFHGAWRA